MRVRRTQVVLQKPRKIQEDEHGHLSSSCKIIQVKGTLTVWFEGMCVKKRAILIA